MDMHGIHSGKLRAIGYEPRQRILRVEFDDGRLLEHSGVSPTIWERLSQSASAWSYYRDNIEEEFPSRRVSSNTAKSNPLDDLFK